MGCKGGGGGGVGREGGGGRGGRLVNMDARVVSTRGEIWYRGWFNEFRERFLMSLIKSVTRTTIC